MAFEIARIIQSRIAHSPSPIVGRVPHCLRITSQGPCGVTRQPRIEWRGCTTRLASTKTGVALSVAQDPDAQESHRRTNLTALS